MKFTFVRLEFECFVELGTVDDEGNEAALEGLVISGGGVVSLDFLGESDGITSVVAATASSAKSEEVTTGFPSGIVSPGK